MIRINLLSPELIKKEERNEFLFIGYAVIAILVAIGAVQYTSKLARYRKLDTRVNKVQQELGKYEEIVKQVDALQASKQVLEKKKGVIDSLMKGRLLYPRFMEELMELMPSNVWIKNMNTQTQPDGTLTVSIDAEALDNYAIADIISAMAANKNFSSPELVQINAATSAKTTTSVFRMTFSYRKVN